ncbi:2772_t:CDS:2 [Racocetra fulgida]|uniref:2772_t:CDS:1 n=1 Tax=Racocetra fulgida TaxID=60492 RepID=A0A9N9CVX9_9GLOM|nr:2772_t:CDS:2 [Racocetra fulgida]
MSEEIQNTPIEENSEVPHRRAMCLKHGLQVDGSKAELVGHLEAFWNDPEKKPVKSEAIKRKSADSEFSKKYDERDGFSSLEEFCYNDVFFFYMENKVEKKIEKKLSNSLSRDQYEYNAICDASRSNSRRFKKKGKGGTGMIKTEAIYFKVAEEEGWNQIMRVMTLINYWIRLGRKQSNKKDLSYHIIEDHGNLKDKDFVEIFENASLAIRNLLQRVRKLAKDSVSPFYKAKSEK